MVYTFGINKHIDEYTKEYDKLPDHPDPAKNPNQSKIKDFDEPSKETIPKPADRKKYVELLIKNNTDNTACASCPKQGKCVRLDWKKEHSFIKITGCSEHPDQVKFKGRSTTVVITDTTVSTLGGSPPGAWAGARGATDYNTSFQAFLHELIDRDGAGVCTIYRSLMVYDTSAILPAVTVTDAKFRSYQTAVDSASGVRDLIVMIKGVACPHNPVVSGDFDITNYAGECGTKARATFVAASYNDITFSDLTAIIKGGTTRFAVFYSADVDNTEPGGAALYGIRGLGPTDAMSPPKLEVTYDVPPPPVPTSNPGWSGTGQRASWEGLSLPARITVAPRHQRI